MSGIRVLVIDDNEAHAGGLAELLGLYGFETAYTTSGLDGLELLSKWAADVVISDVNLPDMDGFEICRAIRNNPALDHVAFLYHTASPDMLGAMHGGDAFITYPISADQLALVIKGCMAKRMKERMRQRTRKSPIATASTTGAC